MILRGCERVDLKDVALEDWVRSLTSLALQDVDPSAAADRWMRYPDAHFVLPVHSFTAERAEGAFFLYGSMDEALATPALLRRLPPDPAWPERELALSLLAHLATPAADEAFQSVDLSGFSAQAQTGVRSAIANRPIFERRDSPKSTREEILNVFQPIVDHRDFRPFMELVERAPDGERDVVTVMTRDDLPLICRCAERWRPRAIPT